ncbi:hypothetical protein [Prosthecobacter sp.]|uniref:hypothetical protein n=1 Tax=Prosthecobacter sp. TaxID=1965333 RepID=UPI003783C34E
MINIPDAYGAILSRSELRATLHGYREDPKIRAVLQILAVQREECMEAASSDAHRGDDTRYQLGGRQAVDDVLAMLLMLLENGEVHSSLKEFFRDK